MKYIHTPGDEGIQFDRYSTYILPLVGSFPAHLRALVSESRFYDLSSSETLHDANLTEFCIRELEADRDQMIPASVQIRISLRGVHQMIELTYSDVKWYRVRGENDIGYFDSFHSDLFTHEFRLEEGLFIHELEFVTASAIEIAFGSMEYRFFPYP